MTRIDDARLDSLADQLLSDYDTQNPGTVFGNGLRLELADAWQLQHNVTALREHRGEKVIGYKVGCVSEGNQKAMGLTHPVWGRLWSTEQHGDMAELSLAKFANLGIEAEFAIILNRDLDLHGLSSQTFSQSVESVFPVLELHNLVLQSDPPKGHELIANNAIHAGVVRGNPVADPLVFHETDLALIYEGATVDSWSGIQWPTDFVSPVRWLAEQLGREGKPLKKGDMILTGAWGLPVPVENTRCVEVKSSAFGDVRAKFA